MSLDVVLTTIIDDVWTEDCESLSKHCLSEWLVVPAHPILFGLFQFVYFTNRSITQFKQNITPDFVCFNPQRCPILLTKIVSLRIINGLACCPPSDLVGDVQMKDFNDIKSIFSFFDEECLRRGIDKTCKNSSYFHCNESMKCIAYHRVGDGWSDCYFGEDESFDTCQLNDSKRYKCHSNSTKCFSPVANRDGSPNCLSSNDDVFTYTQNNAPLMSFPELSDACPNSMLNLLEMTETDETNCDWWPCDNPNTRCNTVWHCPNGADEFNCPNTKCSYNEYECANIELGLSYCIPLPHLYEKYLYPCNTTDISRSVYHYNGTIDISEDYMSWNNSKCITADKLCRVEHYSQTSLGEKKACSQLTQPIMPYTENVKFYKSNKYLCTFPNELPSFCGDVVYYFKAAQLGYFPKVSINYSIPTIPKTNQMKTVISSIDGTLSSYCHRGIVVLSGKNEIKVCLCPPNYFGDRCEWQNERISLTIQLVWRSSESFSIVFELIIMLIDENGEIMENHEKITYMPSGDCNTKYNIYLLYPHRPKSLLNKYSVRIDLYEKHNLKYWSSWFLPIIYPFLPVNRIVSQLIIPEYGNNELCNLSCGIHGKCRYYINKNSSYFCHCDEGYSGGKCEIKEECNCSNDSYCISSSICVCPLYKFGLYCHLRHRICDSLNNPCKNNGICIPIDDRIGLQKFRCFCSEDYSGERCENANNRIDIYLNGTILSNNSLLLIHFITGFENADHERITSLKKIPYNQNILAIQVKQSFNILFIEIPKQDYYLMVLRERFLPSEYIYTEMEAKQRCFSINELVNRTFFQYEYLRQVKYYPLICQEYSSLMCFYDNYFMCICDTDRFSNCFLFNRSMNNDCQGYSYCLNGGECYQNNETCPTKITCICPDCYYGARCQLSTKGYLFSLDSILGYHIKPNLSINKQPLIIKISIAITTILFVMGLINGFLSMITFRRQIPRQAGSGNYLFISSIISIIMIITLTIKFCQLVLSQMSLIANRNLLKVNCILTDVSLRILLSSNEWLNACVAIERMITVIKGTSFNKIKSKKMCKWVIVSVFILTIVTHIHDPLHRQLIDDFDIDEKRIWCFVRYSSSVEIYNSFITLFHFIISFIINIISALWIIIKISYNRNGLHPDQTFRQHLKQQIAQHRHLLIGSCVLILLTLPRLIISFVSGCMRSAREPWLYLFGYFISFIPSMLTFVIFILPSKTYKGEFDIVAREIIKRFRRNT